MNESIAEEAEAEFEEALQALGDDDDRPDPSELEAASKEDVLHQRKDGKLKTETVAVEFEDGYKRMEIRAPTIFVISMADTFGDDVPVEKFADIYEDMVADPELTADEWRQGDMVAYVDLIGPVMRRIGRIFQSDLVNQAEASIEERSEAAAGN